MSGRGSKQRSSRRDAGTGSSGRDVYQAPSYRMPNRTKDVVEHARQVQRDLSSMGLENKRHAEQMDQEAYTNRLQHLILDHLAAWKREDWLSSFMFQVDQEARAQHKTQKAIKHFVEEFLDDVVEGPRTEGECRAVPIRMRTVKEEKKGSSKKEDGEEQRAQRRRPQQRE